MAKKQTKKYAQIIIIGLLIVALGLSIIFTAPISKAVKRLLGKADIVVLKDDIVVHYIDVGQGDAIAINFPDDKIMLIDSGPKDGQNVLLKYLKDEVFRNKNDLVIDYVVLTHSDIDHSGGLSAVFGEFGVKNFYRPNIASDSEMIGDFAIKSSTQEYDELIKLSKAEHNVTINIINKEYVFNVGNAVIEILPPAKVYSSTNDMSCVIKLSYMGKSFLFAGDIQGDSERDMLSSYGKRLDVDVLKVAHHGSKTSTGQQFVDVATPEYAIICVGSNEYGHPHFETISRLEDYGCEIYLTIDGSVRFVCGKENFGVLGSNQIHSYEFIGWWLIAVCAILLLIYKLIRLIIGLILEYKKQNKEIT